MRIGYYTLIGQTPVPEPDATKWALWFENAERRVDYTDLSGCYVSTVFLGCDHRFAGDGPPLLFETLVFGGPNDGEMDRCSTWIEAEEMHRRMVEKVRGVA